MGLQERGRLKVMGLAIDQGLVSLLRMAGLLGVTVEGVTELFASHGLTLRHDRWINVLIRKQVLQICSDFSFSLNGQTVGTEDSRMTRIVIRR